MSLFGGVGRCLVVVLTAVAGERMTLAGVCMDRDERVAAESRRHLRLGVFRHEFVLFGDVEQERLPDVSGFAQHGRDIHAVVADGAIGIGARRRQVGEKTAQAIPDCADLAAA